MEKQRNQIEIEYVKHRILIHTSEGLRFTNNPVFVRKVNLTRKDKLNALKLFLEVIVKTISISFFISLRWRTNISSERFLYHILYELSHF